MALASCDVRSTPSSRRSFVRACYDYNSDDDNLLSFKAGAVIEVLGQQDSGWWDGLLDNSTRGWFPSNFVEAVSEDQAKKILNYDYFDNNSSCPTQRRLADTTEAAVRELLNLIELTSLPRANWPKREDPEKVKELASKFVQCSTRSVHVVRHIIVVSGVAAMAQADPDKLQEQQCISLIRCQMLVREKTSLLSLVVKQMRELTRYLFDSLSHSAAFAEYFKTQRRLHDNTLHLIEIVKMIGNELQEGKLLINTTLSTQAFQQVSPAEQSSPTLLSPSQPINTSGPSTGLPLPVDIRRFFDTDTCPEKDHIGDPRMLIRTFQASFAELAAELQASKVSVTWITPLRDMLVQAGTILILMNGLYIENSNLFLVVKQRLLSSAKSMYKLADEALKTNANTPEIRSSLWSFACILRFDLQSAVHMVEELQKLTSVGTDRTTTICSQLISCSPTLETSHSPSEAHTIFSTTPWPSQPPIPQLTQTVQNKQPCNDAMSESLAVATSSIFDAGINPKDIVFGNGNSVKGGTLEALVIHLTRHDAYDSKFTYTFLTTLRSFTTSEEFIILVTKRFQIPMPKNLTTEQQQIWRARVQRPVQLCTINILKMWLKSHYEPSDLPVLDLIDQFAHTHLEKYSMQQHQILRLTQRCQKGILPCSRIPSVLGDVPKPILPRNLRKFELTDLDPLEVARQLTLLESAMFQKVRDIECIGKAWMNRESSGTSNISALVAFHNQVTEAIADTLLEKVDIFARVGKLHFYISLAYHCRMLNNFSTMWSIVSALNSASIFRLRRTWGMLSAEALDMLNELNTITNVSKNYGMYRELLSKVNPPCVPFMGLYTKDLTFIEDGNPDQLQSDPRLINFSKRQRLADVILEIQTFQKMPYNFERIPEIETFLRNKFQKQMTDQQRYDRSLALEPRAEQIPRREVQLESALTSNDRITKLLRQHRFI